MYVDQAGDQPGVFSVFSFLVFSVVFFFRRSMSRRLPWFSSIFPFFLSFLIVFGVFFFVRVLLLNTKPAFPLCCFLAFWLFWFLPLRLVLYIRSIRVCVFSFSPLPLRKDVQLGDDRSRGPSSVEGARPGHGCGRHRGQEDCQWAQGSGSQVRRGRVHSVLLIRRTCLVLIAVLGCRRPSGLAGRWDLGGLWTLSASAAAEVEVETGYYRRPY